MYADDTKMSKEIQLHTDTVMVQENSGRIGQYRVRIGVGVVGGVGGVGGAQFQYE